MRALTGIAVAVVLLAVGGAGLYVVKPGDTLGGIARRTGTSPAALAKANGISNPNRIVVGQRLTIPTGGSGGGAGLLPGDGLGYRVVRPGDTLRTVAAGAHVSPTDLAAWNGITDGALYRGARIRLTPPPNPMPPAPKGGGTYVVKAGDSLARIAARFGTSVAAVAKANGIANANLVRIGQRLTVPGAGGGRRCPVAGKVSFMNDYGFPRSGGRFHEGNDLMATRGTPLVALVGGAVTQKLGSRAGRQVTLAGDDGVVWIYAHLNSFGAQGRVPAGAVVGAVGSSGDAEGGPTHLHIEAHPGGGGPVNPFPTLQEACRG